ncbi:DUF2157 domain-containing protein [Actinopolymorpha sp. B9G3]|uniref:DUF2157 domain-containing protein n=1 Tax=Actinopolymorpha sp. B9G3 TaxID=3158970 RepID=UPI0032D994B9
MSTDHRDTDPMRNALAGLVREGTLSEDQARRVGDVLRRSGVAPAQPRDVAPERRERVVEVLSYLGGALVIGALILIVGLAWSDLNRAGKLAICGGATVLLLVAAMAVGGLVRTTMWPTGRGEPGSADSGNRQRDTLAATLGALGSGGAAFTVGVAIDVDGFRALVLPGVAMVIVAAASYVMWGRAPLVCAAFGGGLLIAIALIDMRPQSWSALVLTGIVLMVYGALWIGLGRILAERDVAGVLGGAIGLIGAELASIENDYAWVGLLLGLVGIAAMFAMFWTSRRWWYAVFGAAGALVIPPTALGVMFDNALLVGVVLLLIGVALIVGAVATLRRRGRLSSRPPADPGESS